MERSAPKGRVALAALTTLASAALVALGVLGPASATAHRPHPVGGRADLRAPALSTTDEHAFGVRPGSGPCAGVYEAADAGLSVAHHHGGIPHRHATPAGTKTCTHGVDRAPELPAGLSSATTAAAAAVPAVLDKNSPGIPCFRTGPFVRVFYGYRSGGTNRVARRAPFIRETVAVADRVYNTSARRVGATRHVRWKMSSGCRLVVKPVAFSRLGDLFGMTDSLLRRGYLRPGEKALIFMEAGGYGCSGLGMIRADTRASASRNVNNKGGMGAWATLGCFDTLYDVYWAGGLVTAHELGHTLGAVQDGAPYSNNAGHCVDEWDVMCYDDGSGKRLVYRCGSRSLPPFSNVYDTRLDCGLNTYFNPHAPAGSYLSRHWNIARSSWLARSAPARWDRLARPRVAMLTPTGSYVGGRLVLRAKAKAPAGTSLKRVEFLVNGRLYGSDSTGVRRADGWRDYGVTVETRRGQGGWANGTVLAFRARVLDQLSRPGASGARKATVSNPTVAFVSPGAEQTVPATTRWRATAAAGPGRTLTKVALVANGTTIRTDSAPHNSADGSWGGTVDLTSYVSKGSVELRVRAYDSAGNSVASGPHTVYFTPIDVQLDTNSDVEAGRNVTVLARITPTPGLPVSKVQFYRALVDPATFVPGPRVGIGNPVPAESGKPFSVIWKTSASDKDRLYELSATAYDATGAHRSPDWYNSQVYVDPPPDPPLTSTVRITSPSQRGALPGSPLRVTGTLTLGAGFDPVDSSAALVVSVGDAVYGSTTLDAPLSSRTVSWSVDVDPTGLEPGDYLVSAYADLSDSGTLAYEHVESDLVAARR